MLEIITGGIGTGKTLYTVIEADEHRERFPDAVMVSNFHTRIPRWEYWSDVMHRMSYATEKELENSFWVVDASYLWFGPRRSEQISEDQLMILDAAIGFGARILLTTQRIVMLDQKIIERAKHIVECSFSTKVGLVARTTRVYAELEHFFNLYNTGELPTQGDG